MEILIGAVVILVIIGKILMSIPRANPNLICPHCQVGGHVTTVQKDVKRGISGGKATAGLLTGGVSLLATGLSRKQNVTACSCKNCGMEWLVG
jgi:hypothetical protein